MATLENVPRNSGARGPHFVKSDNGKPVSVSPGKGGVSIGTPIKCVSTRSAPNVKGAWAGHGGSY